MKRVFVAGVFDLFHADHARMLQAAKLHDKDVYLLVGVCSDQDTILYKKKPIMTHQERMDVVASCKWVDEIIPDVPWVLTEEFLQQYEIDVVCHNGLPYDVKNTEGDILDAYGIILNTDREVIIPRGTGISTTELINRVASRMNTI